MNFPERFEALEQLLASRRSEKDGGWPQKLGADNGATTITATAQTIEMLRIRGHEYEDSVVQSGLGYLARRFKEQSSSGWNRYPAYALWGLMRYPLARKNEELGRAIESSYDQLYRQQLMAGGWSQQRKEGPLWLPATMVAVHALDRLAAYTGRGHKGVGHTAARARQHVASEARPGKRKGEVYWKQTPRGTRVRGRPGWLR